MARSFEELFASGPGYALWTAGDWNVAGKLLPAFDPTPEQGEVSALHWQGHREGKRALIVSPIMEDRTVYYGVIDVDPNRKSDRGPAVAEQLFQLLHSKELPFAVCESKSNGAHAYIFFDQPELSTEVNKVLQHIVDKLDLVGKFKAHIDIRPTQAREGGGAGIQLPYFGTEAIPGATSPRAMMVEGRYLTVDEFVDWVNLHSIVDWPTFRRTVTAKLGPIVAKHTLLNNVANYEDKAAQGPPCFEPLLLGEPNQEFTGSRNDIAAHLAARLPMMFDGEDEKDYWKEILHKWNLSLASPLGSREIGTIIMSQEKTSFGLKCTHPEIAKLCQRDKCKTRKYGVLARNTTTPVIGCDIKKIVKFRPPEGDDKSKYPVHIYLEGCEGYIITNQDALTSWAKFAADVFHNYKFHIPHMKAPAFHAWINAMLGREGDVFFEEPMPREMTVQGRFEREARNYLLSHIHRSGEITRDKIQGGTVLWDDDKKCLVLEPGVFLDQMRKPFKDITGLTNSRIMDMFNESQLLAKNTHPWKAQYHKHGIFSNLMHFYPRYEGDGKEYTEDERDTLWFVPPEVERF